MTELVVHPAEGPLSGVLPCPPDAWTATLAALFAATSVPHGESQLAGRGLPRLPAEGARWARRG